MNAWTSAARDELNRFLTRIRQPLEQAGADAAEVVDDIRRHIDEEIAASRLRVVTVTELQPMLARIGQPWNREVQDGDKAGAAQLFQALKTSEVPSTSGRESSGMGGATLVEPPEPAPAPAPIEPPPEETYVAKKARELKLQKPPFSTKPKPGIAQMIFGVILPLATLLIEWITGFCASNIFDPIPTWGHILLVALVPAVNGFAWFAMNHDRDEKFARYLPFGLGAALGVSILYSIVYLPIAPAGVIALVIGLGLLPLTPYLALGSSMSLRTILKRRLEQTSSTTGKLRFYPGMLAAFAIFALMHISFLGTTSLIRMAANPSSEKTALSLLKFLGSEKTLLEACYGLNRRSAPALLWMLDMPQVEVEQARRVYFQLYGRAYNSVPKTGPRAFTAWDSRTDWDPDRGGTKVGTPVPNLSLASSRIDATVEPNAAISYLEWVVEFNNAGMADAEARCEIELPPGATVSRLTLWINGEEREAAFAGKAQVREAYQNVVVVQRRDPVLVTSSGKDRIMMQCFPVQPSQRMKMRVGMTVPLLLDSQKNGVLRWPYIRERNFALGEKLEHSFWIDSPLPIDTLSIPLKTERTASGHYMARGNLSERTSANLQPAVLIRRNPAVDTSWASDTRANDGSVVLQTIREKAAHPIKDLILVLDGSASMRDTAATLARLPIHSPLRVVIAGDTLQEFSARNTEELARQLKEVRFKGGHDNVPALERAWDLAAENGSGAIVWIHGTQPVAISSVEGLVQRFQRRPKAVQLFDLPADRSPNVIATALPPTANYELVSMHRPAAEMAAEILREASGASKRFETVREKIRTTPQGAESNLHLARLWAFDEVNRFVRKSDHSKAIEIAALYQLVTEVSGAVVLETADQYKRAGLEPVSPSSVPVVPEPSTWALIILGAVVFLALRRRKTPAPATRSV